MYSSATSGMNWSKCPLNDMRCRDEATALNWLTFKDGGIVQCESSPRCTISLYDMFFSLGRRAAPSLYLNRFRNVKAMYRGVEMPLAYVLQQMATEGTAGCAALKRVEHEDRYFDPYLFAKLTYSDFDLAVKYGFPRTLRSDCFICHDSHLLRNVVYRDHDVILTQDEMPIVRDYNNRYPIRCPQQVSFSGTLWDLRNHDMPLVKSRDVAMSVGHYDLYQFNHFPYYMHWHQKVYQADYHKLDDIDKTVLNTHTICFMDDMLRKISRYQMLFRKNVYSIEQTHFTFDYPFNTFHLAFPKIEQALMGFFLCVSSFVGIPESLLNINDPAQSWELVLSHVQDFSEVYVTRFAKFCRNQQVPTLRTSARLVAKQLETYNLGGITTYLV